MEKYVSSVSKELTGARSAFESLFGEREAKIDEK